MEKKFIKGQWYKGSHEYYMKFDRKVKDNGFNRLYSTEQIIIRPSGSIEHHRGEDHWSNSDFERCALEHGPLSAKELSGILPESHADRITDYYEIY
jgi:hypothetical protein